MDCLVSPQELAFLFPQIKLSSETPLVLVAESVEKPGNLGCHASNCRRCGPGCSGRV